MSRREPDRAVRKATRGDAAVIAEILGDAFRDDPVLRWLLPDDGRRHRNVPAYFLAAARHLYLPHQEVYLTESASGAALWLPPGVPARALPVLPSLGLFWRLFWATGLAGLRRANAVSAALLANHPSRPHYYLHALGVRSGRQGRGVGSALIGHVTERCDREGALAYLENSNVRNLPLYERSGFRVVGEWQAPGGGPRVWFMERPPA